MTNGANEAIARDQLRGGSFDPEARGPEPRANPGPANQAREPQEEDASDALLVALSGLSGMSPAPWMEARTALGCRHPPAEREGNPPRNVYHSPSNPRAG